ncbi:pitrilysin family protein [Streptococcaceae bacterium ESL0687]|nr:pitrilysin family protein [Streptococcaceae bacterium ESL0687]
MLKKINYQAVEEGLYQEDLENGLRVYYLPQPLYNKTYALFTSKFGSLDTSFVPYNQEASKTYPEGIAHFLEHKLFEKESGDVFQDFSKLGAASNAFTSFERTSYLFSTSEEVYASLEVLLDFVQEPYFTEEGVTSEQGIIGQEIQMYQDDPDWRLYFGLLQSLYPESPLAADIAGSPKSISEITVTDLYENYESFYQPGNMNLFITGPFEINQMADFVRKNQDTKNFPKTQKIKRDKFQAADSIAYREIEMDLVNSKFALGFRGKDSLPSEGAELLSYRMSNFFLFTMLFGSTSKRYERLYNEGLIDDSFDYNFELHERFHMASITCDSEDPKFLEEEFTAALNNFELDPDFTEEHLKLIKKDYLGNYFKSMNSLEFIASQFASNIYEDLNFFDYPAILEKINLDLVRENGRKFISSMEKSVFCIKASPVD